MKDAFFINDQITAAESSLQIPTPGEMWKHTKRGTTYRILYLATMQSEISSLDNTLFVVYQSVAVEEKKIWIRSVKDFVMNQRFTIVSEK